MKLDELSASERLILAQQLWDSVANDQNAIELTAAQKTELDNEMEGLLRDYDEPDKTFH